MFCTASNLLFYCVTDISLILLERIFYTHNSNIEPFLRYSHRLTNIYEQTGTNNTFVKWQFWENDCSFKMYTKCTKCKIKFGRSMNFCCGWRECIYKCKIVKNLAIVFSKTFNEIQYDNTQFYYKKKEKEIHGKNTILNINIFDAFTRNIRVDVCIRYCKISTPIVFYYAYRIALTAININRDHNMLFICSHWKNCK